MEQIKNYISDSVQTQQKILADESILDKIQLICETIISALKHGNKILFVGNGGSASDCDHLATEFVSKFYKDRHAFNAISLTSNNALITALSNDFGYDKAFSRQIEAIGKKGDVLFALSTSGNSKNVVESINIANEMELTTIGLVGAKKSDMDSICSILIKVPSKETPNIQESQMIIGHLICKLVEDKLFGKE
ncbi:SIS domain-containing protein [bacterium]|nr:SIS domain-containing protein [bacterium]